LYDLTNLPHDHYLIVSEVTRATFNPRCAESLHVSGPVGTHTDRVTPGSKVDWAATDALCNDECTIFPQTSPRHIPYLFIGVARIFAAGFTQGCNLILRFGVVNGVEPEEGFVPSPESV